MGKYKEAFITLLDERERIKRDIKEIEETLALRKTMLEGCLCGIEDVFQQIEAEDSDLVKQIYRNGMNEYHAKITHNGKLITIIRDCNYDNIYSRIMINEDTLLE